MQPVSQPASIPSLLWGSGFPREAFELCNEVTGRPRSCLCGQSMAPVKGGAKHQLKARGRALVRGSRLELSSRRPQLRSARESQYDDNRCGMSALTWTNPAASRGKRDMTRDLWKQRSHAAHVTLWTVSDWTVKTRRAEVRLGGLCFEERQRPHHPNRFLITPSRATFRELMGTTSDQLRLSGHQMSEATSPDPPHTGAATPR